MLIHKNSKIQDYLKLNEEGAFSCEEIFTSLPYGMNGIASDDFYDIVLKSKKKTTNYFRIDWSIPFDTRILEKYKDENITFLGVKDYLHAKVIWWKGWGVYIGSCNLTDRACFENFEAGVFLNNNEMVRMSMGESLFSFFKELESSATPCDEKLVEILKLQNENIAEFRKMRVNLDLNFRKLLVGAKS